jgi:hypothetical protein
MYEVIISNVRNGRVRRRQFQTRDEAERYVDVFFYAVPEDRPQRNPRDFRVEVHPRPQAAFCAA